MKFWRVKVLGSGRELVKAVGAPSALMTTLKSVLAAGLSLLCGEAVRGYQQWKLQPRGTRGGDSRREGWGSSSAAVAELYGHSCVPTRCHLPIVVTTSLSFCASLDTNSHLEGNLKITIFPPGMQSWQKKLGWFTQCTSAEPIALGRTPQ